MARSLIFLLLLGCSSGGASAVGADAASVEVRGGADATAVAGADGASSADQTAAWQTTCDKAAQRIKGCGLHYSFPSFATDCVAWIADGRGDVLDVVASCNVKVCAEFRTCMTDAIAR